MRKADPSPTVGTELAWKSRAWLTNPVTGLLFCRKGHFPCTYLTMLPRRFQRYLRQTDGSWVLGASGAFLWLRVSAVLLHDNEWSYGRVAVTLPEQ